MSRKTWMCKSIQWGARVVVSARRLAFIHLPFNLQPFHSASHHVHVRLKDTRPLWRGLRVSNSFKEGRDSSARFFNAHPPPLRPIFFLLIFFWCWSVQSSSFLTEVVLSTRYFVLKKGGFLPAVRPPWPARGLLLERTLCGVQPT